MTITEQLQQKSINNIIRIQLNPTTTRIKKKDALLKLMIKPFQETKNKKLKDRLKALEKSFHLGAIPLF